MVRVIISLLVLISFAGCGRPSAKTQDKAQKNVQSLLSLDIGMTKDEVITTMGKPKKKEKRYINDRTIEFWFYLTEGLTIDDGRVRDAAYTPLAFENGKLIGWGRRFYDRPLQHEHTAENK